MAVDRPYIFVGSSILDVVTQTVGQDLAAQTPFCVTPGGSGVNGVVMLARFNVPVKFLSGVGKDAVGQLILSELDKAGVDTSLISVSERQMTPLSICTMDQLGNKFYTVYRFPGYSDPLSELSVSADLLEAASNAGLFHFSEAMLRQEGPRQTVMAMAERAARGGAPVVYSSNLRLGSWPVDAEHARRVMHQALNLASCVLMNLEEALFLSGSDSLDAALDWVRTIRAETTVITLGRDGAIIQHQGKINRIPAPNVRVVFDAGAGDVFHAVFAGALRQGVSPLVAAYWASAAAGLKVSRPYTLSGLPSKEEVRDLLRTWVPEHAETWQS